MVRGDDISSTERLLELIRENSGTDSADEIPSLRPVPAVYGTASKTEFHYDQEQDAADIMRGARGVILPQTPKSFYQKLISFREKITVGIDIGNGYLKLVRFSRTGGQKQKLTAYMSVPAEKDLSTEKPLSGFLKSVLKIFCHSISRMDIWAVMPLENTEMRFLAVPAVSPKDLPKTVYWAYKRIKPFNEAENIFDFEYIGEYTENGIKKNAVMVYTAPRSEIEKVRNIFSEAGFPLTGISVYPFAIQNLVKSKYIRTEGQNICCLYVGMNWSRIDIFFPDGNLALSRIIRACLGSMLEELRIRLNEQRLPPDPENAEPDESYAEKQTPVSDDVIRKIFFALVSSSPELEILLEENELNITAGDIFGMLVPAIERLVWKLERTIESYQMDIEKKGVGKIFISGEISGCRRVIDYIGKRMDQRVETRDMDPFACDFVDKDMQIPDSAAERGGYVPAAGIALSRNFFTPNLIFSYEDKQKYLNSRRADRFVSIVFALIAIVSLFVCFDQEKLFRQKRCELEKVRKEYEMEVLSRGNMVFDRDMIKTLADRITERREHARNFARRYTDVAVISAICESTKDTRIRLTELKLIAGETKGGGQESRNKAGENIPGIILEGIITAEDAVKREAILLDYMADLNAVMILGDAVLRNRTEQKQEKSPVLHFTIHISIRAETKKK
ncbi:MAG: hypothetical protein AB7S75_09840 [Desulfococcaceae bacterium]